MTKLENAHPSKSGTTWYDLRKMSVTHRMKEHKSGDNFQAEPTADGNNNCCLKYRGIALPQYGLTWSMMINHAFQGWLVVSIPLKNISQLGLLFPIYIYGKIKNVPNHQPEDRYDIFRQSYVLQGCSRDQRDGRNSNFGICGNFEIDLWDCTGRTTYFQQTSDKTAKIKNL